MGQDSTYRFGAFELDPCARQLRRNGVRLKLYGQSFHILLMLLERPGEVVTREELRKGIWPEGTFVDFEHGLNAAIKNLRRTLSDSADKPSFVETVPRVGYRFCGRVEQAPSDKLAVSDTSDVRLTAPPEKEEIAIRASSIAVIPNPRRPLGSRWQASAVLVFVVLCAISAAVYWKWLRPHASSEAAQSGRIMMAVLPFKNLTGDPAQDYFSEGFSEDLITQLGPRDPQHLEVVARTSTMMYQHAPASLQEIGRKLGVQYALEGAVQRDGGNVRISARLIRLKDQTCVWSRQYNRKLDDALAVEDEIAREIVDEIDLTFGSRAPARPAARSSENYETYDLYLRGRYFWNKRTAEGFQRAAEYFQQAIAKDPGYARAYVGLADTYSMMCSWNQVSPSEFMPKARAAALKALELDDSLPEAHASLALIVENYDWDWQTAEKEYRRAIQLNPGYASAHQWYAEYLTWEGRFDEASRESERARQLDPLSLIIAADHGAMLYYTRQYKQSIDQFHSVLEMDPHFPRATFVVYPYVQSRMYGPALASVKEQRVANGEVGWVLSMQAYVEANAGRTEEAQLALDNLQQLKRRQQVDPQLFFWPYIALGNKQKALDSLEQALSRHSNIITGLKVEPAFDPLRGDPRFQTLMRQAGLAN